jgi:arylsulfatase
MVVHWPDGIAADQAGTLRDQFVYVADIVPTIYELIGITPPETLKGHAQLPVTGHSFAGAVADASASSTNTLQYFEMNGSRALVVRDGDTWWKAVAKHDYGAAFDDDRWELYDLSADPSECNDLAESDPERLEQVVALWWQEADRHGVLPLDDRALELFRTIPHPHSAHRPDRRYRYVPPMSPIPSHVSASPGGRGFHLTARLTRAPGDEGVIYATGTENSGLSAFVQGDRLVFDYNAFDDHTVVESEVEVPVGDSVVEVRLRRTSRRTGNVEVVVDGAVCGSADLPFMMSMISSIGASIGEDHGSAVSGRYEAPFPFTGTLHDVEIQLGAITADDAETTARTEMARQ